MVASETPTLVSSEKTVSVAGTPEPLSSSSQRIKSLTLIAKAGNTGEVYVGGSDVASATNDGLAPGGHADDPRGQLARPKCCLHRCGRERRRGRLLRSEGIAMATDTNIEYRSNPLRQGSRSRRGDQVDREFIRYMAHLLGDVRALWLPAKSGATLTDKSRYARVLTWSEDVSGFDTKPAELGSGYAITLNGTDEEGDSPDTNELSFGDGAVDQPFSVFAIVNPADATSSVMLSKFDTTASQEEWLFELDASDRPRFALYDDSASARIGRLDATALTQNTWALLVATYDGSGASTGIRIYLNGSRVDDTDDNSGTYTAMENGAELVAVGYRQAAGVKENFFDGKMALVGLLGKELSIDEVWALKQAVNGYFGLSQ